MAREADPTPGRGDWKSIQDENGVDLSLIRANLRLSPEERLRRADAARRQSLWILTHARRIKPSTPPDR
ncbi:MAG: hypothetical protein KF678_12240 [Phycisphaeraceae bacterium]|nr:hypothetical protein [Phycisphaeraceae bacterium]